MVFTSFTFLKFIAVVLLALWLLPSRVPRQILLLVASFYFYAYWKPGYLGLLAVPTLVGYVSAERIEDCSTKAGRKRWVVASIAINLGLLAYFKYTNFFVHNLAALIGRPVPDLNILLPIGISFYTFKILSYTIDVYRGDIRACRDLWKYAMFVSYFPELVAGPIVRATVFLPQMRRSLRFSLPRVFVGLQIVLLGVTKKLLIADQLAVFVDAIFKAPQLYSSGTVIGAVVAYSLQIYCDFSGYSDMAIGISKIIGFDLPENFNMPYLSTSVVEFWRRWHITLSNWLRDYLYFSLGGLRKNPLNRYRNTIITMLLGGLWHGASWNFVFWGLLHGLALCWNQWREDRRRKRGIHPTNGIGITVVNWGCTYVFICFTWIFFRSSSFTATGVILRKVTLLDRTGISWSYSPLYMVLPLIVVAHWIGAVASRRSQTKDGGVREISPPRWLAPVYLGSLQPFALRPSKAAGLYVFAPLPGALGGFLLTGWLLALYLFASMDTSPFIYFQF